MPRMTPAFAKWPLRAPGDVILRWRRPYCAAIVTIRSHTALFYSGMPRRLFWACSKCTSSIDVLCDPTASTGDATALLRKCLRSYCAHLGDLHFSWTAWDRHEDAALVWQGFKYAPRTPWQAIFHEKYQGFLATSQRSGKWSNYVPTQWKRGLVWQGLYIII